MSEEQNLNRVDHFALNLKDHREDLRHRVGLLCLLRTFELRGIVNELSEDKDIVDEHDSYDHNLED